MKESVTFINSVGEKLTFSDSLNSEFFLSQVGDFGDVGSTMTTQKVPLAHGSRYYDSIVNERNWSFEGFIRGVNPKEISELRKKVARIINDAYGTGTILYERDGEQYVLEGVPEGIPSFPPGFENRNYRFQKAIFNFICHDPFWKDPSDREVYLRSFNRKFTMPFKFPIRFGQQSSTVIIYNNGHRETPIEIELRGAAVKPRIENIVTGDYLEINRRLEINERITINTKKAEKHVTLWKPDGTKENIFGDLAEGSTFFSLSLGENKLKYNAVSSYGAEIAKISWRQLYNSI